VRLIIDIDAEMIKVDHSGTVSAAEVGAQVPKTDCAFHFFLWKHMHQGEHFESLIFAFSCPDGSGGTKSAPLRSRMLYATSKMNVAALAESKGFEIAHKMEIGSGLEFAENEFAPILHPVVVQETSFKKPAAPRGRKVVK